MAVDKNPYREWQRQRSVGDYRNTDTQVTSLVRQQLSQQEYLTRSNRVNPGPFRKTRVDIAKQTSIIPHVFGPEDMWGWQAWVTRSSDEFILFGSGTNLLEQNSSIPGISYFPYNTVGGASYPGDQAMNIASVDLTLEPPVSVPEIRYVSYINNIPVDSSNLSPTATDYLMVYEPGTNNFTFRSPSYVLGMSDGDLDPDNLNFGTY